MKCPNCKQENKENVKFCISCGTPLEVPPKKGKEKKKRKKPLFFFFLLLWLVALVGGGIFIATKWMDSSKKETKPKEEEKTPVATNEGKVVPNIVGKTEKEAKELLDTENLVYLFVEEESKEKEGIVLSVSPEEGTILEEGQTIKVIISKKFSEETEKKEWSKWVTKLPDGVNKNDYEIETRTEYRSRTKETTTSKNKTLAGWTYEKAIKQYGPWSSSRTEQYNWVTNVDSKCKTLENSCKSSNTKKVISKSRTRYYVRGACINPSNGSVVDSSGLLNLLNGSADVDHSGSISLWDKMTLMDSYPCGKNSLYTDSAFDKLSYSSNSLSKEVLQATYTGETYKDKYPLKSRITDTFSGKSYSIASKFSGKTYQAYIIASGYYNCSCTYQTRSSSDIYQFYRYGDYSDWTEKKITATDTKKVETRTVYRYREKIK